MVRPCGTYDVNYNQDTAVIRTNFQWAVLIILLVFLCVLPLLVPRSILNVINMVAAIMVAVQGLNILTGYAGQLSIGQAAFCGVGGYTCALLMIRLGVNFWVTLPVAGIVAGLVGLVFGLPSLRLKGFYLAMSTIAAQFIITAVLLMVRTDILGGAAGIKVPPPSLGGITFDTPQLTYCVIMPIVVLMTLVAKSLTRGRLGRAFVAIRDNDLAAEITGINLFRYKLLAFFIGCFFAGISGCLWVAYTWCARPDQFGFMHSVWYLGMIVIGGMGSNVGAIFGVIFVKLLDELALSLAPAIGALIPAGMAARLGGSFAVIVFGIIVIVFLLFEPRGLAHTWEMLKGRVRNWPFSYR